MLGLSTGGGGFSGSSGVGGSDSNKQGSGTSSYNKTVYQVSPSAVHAQSLNNYLVPGLLIVGAVLLAKSLTRRRK